jgi:hypothetical protein
VTRRDFLTGAVGATVTGGAVGTAVVLKDERPTKAVKAKGAPMKVDPPTLEPLQGIVTQVHYFTPGGTGGVIDMSLDNGAGTSTNIRLRAWEQNTQLTWNAAPVDAADIVGNLTRRRANVICWPLAELQGDVLRADFTDL